MPSLHDEIRLAINSMDMEKARLLLRDALKNPDAEILYLASQVALDDLQKKEFLEKAIALDPFHGNARNELSNFQRDMSNADIPASAVNKEANQSVSPSKNLEIRCPICKGSGKSKIPLLDNCKECNGTGQNPTDKNKRCDKCKGRKIALSGQFANCVTCGGKGTLPEVEFNAVVNNRAQNDRIMLWGLMVIMILGFAFIFIWLLTN